jgi:mono/diheme cytochrome c family protein
MKRLFIVVAAIGAIAVVSAPRRAESFAGRHPRVPRQAMARTTWDSVYSDSQARRGDTLYKGACAKCHEDNLAGNDSASELAGKGFFADWDGLTLDQLYDKIYSTMPPDTPSSIPRGQVADILAYILAQNRFPAGAQPLSENMDQLKDITLLKSQP